MGFDSEADARDLARTVWGRTHDSRSWVGDLGSRSGVRPVFRGGGVNVNICLTAHETWDLNRGDENKGIQGYTTHLGFTGYVAYLYFLLQHFQLFTPDYTFFPSIRLLLRIPLHHLNLFFLTSDHIWRTEHHLGLCIELSER